MKSILKKNQIMITALAIMIAVAGYLNFSGTNLAEEDYLSASGDGITTENDSISETAGVEGLDDLSLDAAGFETEDELNTLFDLSEEDLLESGLSDIESLDSEAEIVLDDYLDVGMETALNEETPAEGEVPGEAVFTNTSSVAALSEAKLMKEQTRAKNKESLLEIINSSTLSDEQKQSAVDSMIEMTSVAEKETAAEILLEAKGFEDVVVSIADDGVDVVVNASELTDAQRAQIEDIVKRKTGISAENIIISTVVE